MQELTRRLGNDRCWAPSNLLCWCQGLFASGFGATFYGPYFALCAEVSRPSD